MPEVSRFYGIIIKMYFKAHFPQHFHAIYGENNGIFGIDDFEMLEGDLPSKAIGLIKEWGSQYRERTHADVEYAGICQTTGA